MKYILALFLLIIISCGSPQIGETWYFGSHNPFDTDLTKVEIVDVKDGWILYAWDWVNRHEYTHSKRRIFFVMIYNKLERDNK